MRVTRPALPSAAPAAPAAPAAEELLRHGAFLRRIARSLVRGAADAEDVVQETFLVALERPPRRHDATAAFLRGAARHVAARLSRREARHAARERRAARPEAEPAAADVAEQLAIHRAVVEAVEALSEPSRTIVVLRFFENRPPRRIAARLGLPVATVKSHLQRALEKLRVALDRRHRGARQTWIAALAPFAMGQGAVAMIAGGMLVNAKAWLLVVPAAALLAGLGVVLRTEPEVARAPRSGEDVATAPVEVQPPGAAGRDAAAAPGAAAEVARREAEGGAVVASRVAGRVRIEPRPAEGGLELRDVQIRLLSEARFAHWSGAGPMDVALTPGTWRASVAASGHERALLPPFEVEEGETTDLGAVVLEPGRGALRVLVSPPVGLMAADLRDGLVVELLGEGRRPCPECVDGADEETRTALGELGYASDAVASSWDRDEPCAVCGFARERSVAPADGAAHVFGSLASGEYVLRVFHAEKLPFGHVRHVELRPGESRTVEVMLDPRASVDVIVLDPGGQPFTGWWTAQGKRFCSPFDFRVTSVHGGLHALGIYNADQPPGKGRDLQTWVQSQMRVRVFTDSFINKFLSRDIELSRVESSPPGLLALLADQDEERPAEPPLDRERRPDDALVVWTVPGEPEWSIGVERVAPGHYRLSSLPLEPLRLVVECGPLAGELVLDVRAAQGSRVTLPLRWRRCAVPGEGESGPNVTVQLADGILSATIAPGDVESELARAETPPPQLSAIDTPGCTDCHGRGR